MRLSHTYFIILFSFGLFSCTRAQPRADQKIDFIQLSQDFLYSVKTGNNTKGYLNTLKNANVDELAGELNTDHKRLAFWLNIYNGFTQILLKKNPDQYKSRSSFFSSKQIQIAGQELSLDLIEHGILRRSKIKWSGGYLGKLFPSGFEEKFRVDKLDYRIHFALNCGAKSCPLIAFYEPGQIDKQLNIALKIYLEGEVDFDKLSNVVSVPAIMGWFLNDFGGEKGILEILKANGIIPTESHPAILFKKYDWTLFLNNYK